MPPADRVYRTEGVVLRRHDLGETDRILTIYTRGHGKVRAVAKGVRKPSSRKAGHVELFARVDLLIARGRSLDIVTQAELLDGFPTLRDDLVRTTYAAHFVELVDAVTEDNDPSPSMYALLVAGLSWLCATTDLRRTARTYELHLLDLAGYRPELHNCVVCGKPVKPEDQYFSAATGGVICPRCGAERGTGQRISLNALKVLRYLQSQSFEAIEQLNLSEGVQKEIERLLHETLVTHLERRLKSVAFLDRLRREALQRPSDPPESR